MRYIVELILLLSVALSGYNAASTKCALTGVNLSSGEYGGIDEMYGYKYVYPAPSTINYFLNKGMNVYRIPFRAERFQRYPGGPLVATELTRLDTTINHITNTNKKYALLDPHNYGELFGGKVGQSGSPISVFADFWRKLATYYKNNPRVIFGLMNEPNGQSAAIWWQAAQAAVNAIRNVNATQLILVPGVSWTGAHSWISSGNGDYMRNVTDPANNMAFEVHQYLDSDSSGTHATCVSTSVGVSRLTAFTNWARTYGKRGFLGEFGGGRDSVCVQAIDNTLSYMDNNTDVWLGWTYWAGGAWWPDNYFSVLQPNATGLDRAQWPVVAAHLNTTNITLPIPPKPNNVTVSTIATANTIVYSDSLIGYTDASTAQHSLQNTTVKHGGSRSISVAYNNNTYLGFSCSNSGTCLNVAKYLTLDFWYNPGTNTNGGNDISFSLTNGTVLAGPVFQMSFWLESTPGANTWVRGHFPILMGTSDSANYTGMQFFYTATTPKPNVFFDDISFVIYSDGPGAPKK